MSAEQTLMNMQLDVNAQFIKDLSFENPQILKMLQSGEALPEIDIKINVTHNSLETPDTHEVCLIVHAKGAKNGTEVFVLELNYAGIFTIKNIDEALLHPILMIECPRILFPYVRNIVSEVTRDGGYPPLLLKPVDFADLYRMRLEQMAAEPKGNA
ncbi:protein-export chaperone SecB [Candidatus Bodocaedibacter vickermanii]|uniref:Protein-export protein SecB n=1 Tax=Candidatus Bodocaedibacter vickermanii TaxID=2741701 RepID=A0A7L9RTS7_9PROT|nr:protein-export chaperone SecB [Candidatus Paracaedibacteraceae bacterium 'Lake Konstanz']